MATHTLEIPCPFYDCGSNGKCLVCGFVGLQFMCDMSYSELATQALQSEDFKQSGQIQVNPTVAYPTKT